MGENAESAAKGKETGRLLGGRYRLGDVLGRGGMGTVWRARDEVLGRTVAVKELRFPSDIDEDEKRRLITRTLREAKAIAQIRSGSAVTVFDVVDEDGRPWIVMELIEGRSLADVIKEDGPLTPRRAAEVGLSVLGVLRAAHREGIVHRDVKPSNVLVEEETGRVVLTDFGIAKVEGDPSVTSTGMLVGAPSYISPERARGQRPGPPADLWSLGGLLYAAVEGHPPYDKGSAIATLTAVMTDPLEPPSNAGELEEVIYGLLLKDPEKRLDDAGARVLLQAVLDGPEDSERLQPDSSATVAMPGGASAAENAEAGESGKTDWAAKDRAGGAEKASAPKSGSAAKSPTGSGGSGGERASGEADGASDGRGSKRSVALMIAVVAVVLVGLLGAVLTYVVNAGEDERGSSGKGETSTSGGDGAPGDGDEQGDGKGSDGAGKDGDDSADAGEETDGGSEKDTEKDTEKDGEKDGDGLPDGYRAMTDDRFRFSMVMPEGFARVAIAGRNSGGVYAEKKGALPKLQVDFTDGPTKSALRAWQLIESGVAAASHDYRKIDMKKVKWRDYPTVSDWHFERTERGERVRVLNRGFKVDEGRGYAILITCKASEWDDEQCRTMRETAFDSFQPAGG